MNRLPLRAAFALLATAAAAASLGACSAGRNGIVPAAGSFAPTAIGAKATPKPTPTPGKLKFLPPALNFTTVPSLNMRIKEAHYKGKFKFLVAPAQFVKIAPHIVKGPSAKVVVTSVATKPGTGSITIMDDHGGRKTIKVTVTSGVVIIQ